MAQLVEHLSKNTLNHNTILSAKKEPGDTTMKRACNTNGEYIEYNVLDGFVAGMVRNFAPHQSITDVINGHIWNASENVSTSRSLTTSVSELSTSL